MPTLIVYPASGHSTINAPTITGGSGVTTAYEAFYIALWKIVHAAKFWRVKTDGPGIKVGPGTVQPVCYLNEVGGSFDIDSKVGTHLALKPTSTRWQIRLEFNEWVTIEDLERRLTQAPPKVPSYPKLGLPAYLVLLAGKEIEHPREENAAVGTIAILNVEMQAIRGSLPS